MFELNTLFGIPVYKIHVDPKSFDKEKIIKDIEHNYALSPLRNEWEGDAQNSDLHQSYDDLKNDKFLKINYDKLVPVYKKLFYRFFTHPAKARGKFNFNFVIENYTATRQQQFMTSHRHLPFHLFSVVHYLQFQEGEHVQTVFINGQDFAEFHHYIYPDTFDIMQTNCLEASYLYPKFSLKVKEDDLLIFPSVLKHEIPKQKKVSRTRITIATNVHVKKTSK